MTLKDWIQLAFALSNGASFALTIRHDWREKLAGSAVLVCAHPMVAVYFAVTGQPFFIIGNVIMTGAGLYGCWRVLRARRRERLVRVVNTAMRDGWDESYRRARGGLERALAETARDLDRRG